MDNPQSTIPGGVSGTAESINQAIANGGSQSTNPLGTYPPAGSGPNGMNQIIAVPGGFDPGPQTTTGTQPIDSGQSGSGTGTATDHMPPANQNADMPGNTISGPQTNGKPADCPQGYVRCANGKCCPELSGGPLGPNFANGNTV